ncbi:MAG TPA: ferritin-like domain-containing protein [Polyangia bacterium]|nr:ferritin-like domain-containing protein [Polyangia bacterium]
MANQGNGSFITDIQTLRDRAREHIEEGAVTPSYGVDRETAIKLLNDALATELVCVARYKFHYYMAKGIHAESIRAEFLAHAGEEQQHADVLSERIVQLGGKPELDPSGLTARSHSEFIEGNTLVDMIREDLIAERIAIDSYRDMIRFFGHGDSTSRRVMETILAKEEEHAEDLATMLQQLGS